MQRVTFALGNVARKLRLGDLVRRTAPPKTAWRIAALHNKYLGEPELRHLKHMIPRPGCAVDVGAYMGSYTYFLSRFGRIVYAYEPLQESADYLRRVVSPSVVKVRQVALSDKKGSAELHIPLHTTGVRGTGSATLGSPLDQMYETQIVETSTLDLEELSQVGFIKIDVEGRELDVLRGGARTIEQSRPTMLIEVDRRYHQGPIVDVLREIEDYGYRGEFLHHGEWRPVSEFRVDEHQPIGTGMFMHDHKGFINNFLFRPAL